MDLPSPAPTALPTALGSVPLPDDATLERILVVYPSLFVLSVCIYALLRRQFPKYFLLRQDEARTVPQVEEEVESVAALRSISVEEDSGEQSSAVWQRDSLIGRVSYFFTHKLFVVFSYEEEVLIRRIGLDQYLVLRLLRLMIFLLSGYTLIGICLLLPIYQSKHIVPGSHCDKLCRREPATNSDPYAEHSCLCSLIDQSSLANVEPGSDLLWAPVVAMYGATFWALWLLRREYKNVIRLRNDFLAARPPEMYTVLVDEIPSHLGLSTGKALFNHFDSMFPGQVANVNVVGSSGRASSLLKKLRRVGHKRAEARMNLEHAIAQRNLTEGNARPMHLDCSQAWKCQLSYTDSIDAYREELNHCNEKFKEYLGAYKAEAEQFERADGPMLATSAFVTLKSARASAIAVQSLIHEKKNIVVVAAQEPSNILWEALGHSEAFLTCHRYVAQVLFFTLLVVWGSFVTAISLATSSNALGKQFPWLEDLMTKNPVLKQGIDTAAPLVIIALLAVVNPLINQLAKMYSRCSESEIEIISTMWYFVFLVIQVFIFYGIAKNVWSSLTAIIETPKLIFSILAANIPKNAAFYIDFIVTKVFSTLSIELLRVSSFVQAWLRCLCFGRDLTELDRRTTKCGCNSIRVASHCNLSGTSAQLLLVYFIATTYLAIQPLIAPMALAFMTLAYVIYGTVFVNVNLRKYDSGGTTWSVYFWCLMSALFASQGTLFGVLALKAGFEQVAPLWILMFLTAGSSALLNRRYERLATDMPLSVATKVDATTNDEARLVSPPLWQYNRLTQMPSYLTRRKCEGSSSLLLYDYRLPVLQEEEEIQCHILEANADASGYHLLPETED